MERLRILYLINDLRADGGAEVALTNLVTRLDRSQFEIWVGGVFGAGPLAERLQLPPGHVNCFGFHPRFYLDIGKLFGLWSFLKEKRIHIVHTHLFAANTIGRIAAWLAHVPLVVATEHNTYFHKSRWCICVDRFLARVTTQMTAVSEAVRVFAANQARIPRERFVVIPNAIPLKQIPEMSQEERVSKRASLGIEPDRPLILSVGRLTEQKGFPVLLRVTQLVLTEYPEALFMIVGSGHLESELRRQIGQLSLNSSVRLLGFRSDVYELMRISTLFVMPSLWEGLPVALIEASACCLPIVASKVGGIVELVQDEGNGLLVPPKDEVALASGIVRLLASPETRRVMGESGRQLVEARFSTDVVVQQVQDLYWRLWESYLGRRT